MGLNAKHVRELVVRPALELMGFHSEKAENLIMGTAAQESDGFKALTQYGGGPARGLFQVEDATYQDYLRYLNLKDDIRAVIVRECGLVDLPRHADACVWNLRLAAMMARVHYLRIPERLPDANDVWAMAAYWKKYYNTHLGAGTEQEFVDNYRFTQ